MCALAGKKKFTEVKFEIMLSYSILQKNVTCHDFQCAAIAFVLVYSQMWFAYFFKT